MISNLEYLIAVDSMLDEVIGKWKMLELADCEKPVVDGLLRRLDRAKNNVNSVISDMMEAYE